MEYYSSIKNNEILPLTMMWIEPECIMLSERSESEKNKSIPYDFTHMWNLRNKTDEHMEIRGKKREGNKPKETLNNREQTEG